MEDITSGLFISDNARQKFSAAVDKQNLIAQTAIQSLDSLNDQIVQYIFNPLHHGDIEIEKELEPKEQETLKSSMGLIRRLLQDAQAKFRKMVEDNKQLAAKIDGSINAANQEVSALRAELEDTNKRLTEMSSSESLKKDYGMQVEETDVEYKPARQKADEENELIRLREENTRLEGTIRSLSREIEELRSHKVANSDLHPSYGELKLDLIQTKQDLNRAKEALAALKADRKRLKGEKLELLNQMKQLYGTLEDKEGELRDFIRNYEQRMRESDESIKQLATEKETCEREKWEIIQKARHAAEQAIYLQQQLEAQEHHSNKLDTEILELKEQLSNNKMYCLELPGTPKSLESHTPTSEDMPPYDTPPPSASHSSKEDCFHVPTSTPKSSNDSSRDGSNSLTPLLQLMEDKKAVSDRSLNISEASSGSQKKKKKRLSLSSSLSKVFSRGKARRSIALTTPDGDEPPANSRITLLNPENYQEKLKLVDQSKASHMNTWKANQVLAWLEIVLNMPMYGKKCATNIKSGKVLLGMSDSDLAQALNIKNPLHRKKLRLAIEERRNQVDENSCPKCSSLDHTWVAHKWLYDIGLPQYAPVFESNLVDGRMLNNLSRKDMEKHLEIHRKFHQTSILHAVELLRRLGCDKEVLSERRMSDSSASDPLVWTNSRVIEWIQNIDLEEFAENLRESGVHGALMVLEPTFTADTLATALGIPPSKLYIRRHLTTELESLVKPARQNISLGSLKRSRTSRSESLSDTKGSKVRMSLRGSLGRAFGRKVKDDMLNSKLSIESGSDKSPKAKRTSAPVTVDDIPDQIKELDKAIDEAL